MKKSLQTPGVLSIRHLQMIDANVGWAEGSVTGEPNSSGLSNTFIYLLRTTDGGETWEEIKPFVVNR